MADWPAVVGPALAAVTDAEAARQRHPGDRLRRAGGDGADASRAAAHRPHQRPSRAGRWWSGCASCSRPPAPPRPAPPPGARGRARRPAAARAGRGGGRARRASCGKRWKSSRGAFIGTVTGAPEFARPRNERRPHAPAPPLVPVRRRRRRPSPVPPPRRPAPAPGAAADPRLGERAIGRPDAPVQVLEFFSLTCSHCAAFHRDTMPQVKQELVEPGTVRFVYRDFPLDRLALTAAAVARSLPAERYEPFVGALLAAQDRWAFGARRPDGGAGEDGGARRHGPPAIRRRGARRGARPRHPGRRAGGGARARRPLHADLRVPARTGAAGPRPAAWPSSGSSNSWTRRDELSGAALGGAAPADTETERRRRQRGRRRGAIARPAPRHARAAAHRRLQELRRRRPRWRCCRA